MSPTPPEALPSPGVISELAEGRLAENTRARIAWTQQRFTRWAAAHNLPALPATEQTLIRWLHSQEDRLAPMTMRAYADGVRAAHRLAGHPDPGGPRLSGYLVAMTRAAADSGTLRRPRVTAVDLGDVVNAVDTDLLCTGPQGSILQARALVGLLLGRACRAPLRHLVQLELTQVILDDDDLTVHLPTTKQDPARRVHLTRTPGDPLCPVTAVAAYVPHLPAGTTRLLGIVNHSPAVRQPPVVVAEPVPAHRGHRVHEAALRRAGRRAGLELALSPYPSAGMSEGDVRWLLPFLNWQVMLQLRNRAYVLLGIALARRADELNRLLVGDFSMRADGADVLVRSSKTDGEGQGILMPLTHEEDDHSAGCVSHCPVGALQQWTDIMRRLWDISETAPLFPSMQAGQSKPTGTLTTADGSRILRQVLGRDDVSSRTMRASTITALRAEGEPLDRIAEVSGHRSIGQLTRYLRILDPHEDQYHLPV